MSRLKRKKTVTKEMSRAAVALTEGLFSHAVDMTLWLFAYMGELSMPYAYGKTWKAQVAADQLLSEINYEVIKNAITTAKKRGYVKTVRRHAWPEITEEGKRRLASIIPRYDDKRLWDGRMHIVTYDIPEKRKDDRDMLREYIRRIGCGRLQDSVWVTPYNPIDTLRKFIEEHELRGTIIVSDMGKDGSIGEEDIRSMIVRVYKLEDINDRYKEWLEEFENGKIDRWGVIYFLSILKDDPQLPFALLPSWWKGDWVYKRIELVLKNYVNFSATAGKKT